MYNRHRHGFRHFPPKKETIHDSVDGYGCFNSPRLRSFLLAHRNEVPSTAVRR